MQSLLLAIPKKISVKLLDFQKMKLRDKGGLIGALPDH